MKSLDKNKLSKRLKEIRNAKGFTQEKLSEIVDMETTNYSKIENGKSLPSLENYYKLVQGLDVSSDEIFQFNHFEDEKILDETVSKIYNSLPLKKKQCVYKIISAVEDLF